MSFAQKMQYYTLKQQLKARYDKKIHDLEYKYATIIVNLMREKKKRHKQMMDRYCHQMDQLNSSLFEAFSRANSRTQMLDHACLKKRPSDDNHQNIQQLEITPLKIPRTEIPALNKPKSPLKSGGNRPIDLTETEKKTPQRPPPLQFVSNPKEIATESGNLSFDQVCQNLNHRKSESQSAAMDVLLKAIEMVESNRELDIDEMKTEFETDEDSSDSDDDGDDFMIDDDTKETTKKKDSREWVKKGNGFACTICNKVLRRAYDVKRHIACVHTNERPHECDECGATFKLAFHLKEHQLTHLTVRPFKCYFCPKRFTRKRDITKHCKRMHPSNFAQYEAAKQYSAPILP